MKKFENPFIKKIDETRLMGIDDDIDLLRCELEARYEQMLDYDYKDNPEELSKLSGHIAELEKILNDKLRIKAEIEKEIHKPRISTDTWAKMGLTAVSIVSIAIVERTGVIDSLMGKFIPKP